MCELFAASSPSPMCLHYRLNAFSARGGGDLKNTDGWGIVFAADGGTNIFREPAPAKDSALADMIAETHRPSKTVMAHIRRASMGENVLKNTHPFQRVRQGRVQTFAHNGTLEGLIETRESRAVTPESIGETDSEIAFLLLLENIETARIRSGKLSLPDRFSIFADHAREMADYGAANFLFFDGDALFIHAHKRRYVTDEGLSDPRPPGLHMRRVEPDGDKWACSPCHIHNMTSPALLFASVPIDDEDWDELPEGAALAVKDGEVIQRR